MHESDEGVSLMRAAWKLADDGRMVIIMLLEWLRWNGLYFFKTVVNGIQLCLDTSDRFQGSLRLRHDDLMEIALVELVINGQFIGTVHDLVEVAAEP